MSEKNTMYYKTEPLGFRSSFLQKSGLLGWDTFKNVNPVFDLYFDLFV